MELRSIQICGRNYDLLNGVEIGSQRSNNRLNCVTDHFIDYKLNLSKDKLPIKPDINRKQENKIAFNTLYIVTKKSLLLTLYRLNYILPNAICI